MSRPLYLLIFEQIGVWMRQFEETAQTKEEKLHCLEQIEELIATLRKEIN